MPTHISIQSEKFSALESLWVFWRLRLHRGTAQRELSDQRVRSAPGGTRSAVPVRDPFAAKAPRREVPVEATPADPHDVRKARAPDNPPTPTEHRILEVPVSPTRSSQRRSRSGILTRGRRRDAGMRTGGSSKGRSVDGVSEALTLTAIFTPDEDGWTVAQLAEWPSVVTCGQQSTRRARCSLMQHVRCSRRLAMRAANRPLAAGTSSRSRSMSPQLEASRTRASPQRTICRQVAISTPAGPRWAVVAVPQQDATSRRRHVACALRDEAFCTVPPVSGGRFVLAVAGFGVVGNVVVGGPVALVLVLYDGMSIGGVRRVSHGRRRRRSRRRRAWPSSRAPRLSPSAAAPCP